MLKPCAHSAEKYGIDATAWQTHMCGLCLGLRDGHGQLARAATNTDAILLGVLTEAQQPQAASRTEAGPCPLRGMRKASVAAADSPGVRLATTASLLLGAAKIRDHIDDGDTGRVSRRPMARVADSWHARARAAASVIDLDVEPLIAAIESQVRIEEAVVASMSGGFRPKTRRNDGVGIRRNDGVGIRRSGGVDVGQSDGVGEGLEEFGDLLAALTAPTQLCAADLFAHTAILAGRPENADALREVGWHFGRIAHLADAIEDLDDDREHGRFNPLTATGTSTAEAYGLLRESNSLLRTALMRVGLEKVATVRWMLLDPLSGVVRRIGRASGAVRGCASHACGTDHDAAAGPEFHTLQQAGDIHAQRRNHPPQTPHRRPSILEGIGIIATQYCTGYLCCADHTRPCSGERRSAWIDRGRCKRRCCDGCDCACDGCDCCKGCDCCDGCCCDCS